MRIRVFSSNVSLKRRVCIAIALVSILPVIVLFYHFSGYYVSFWTTAILSIVVFLGWWVVFEVFASIIKVYIRSRKALKDIGENIPVIPDEVQSLENMIGILSDKVKKGFEQLRDFTQMTEDLNKEVSRTVLILSTILQANDLFSKDAPAESVVKLIVNHLKHLIRVEVCFCVLEDRAKGKLDIVALVGGDSSKLDSFFKKRKKEASRFKDIIVVDEGNKPKNSFSWSQELGVKNIAFASINNKGRVIGMIGVGNNEDGFSFSKDDLEILGLFAQNVALIWQHERLSEKIEKLEIVDYLTGLYNEKLIKTRLDEEIKRSTIYQRPCGFIELEIVNYDDFREEHGMIEAEKVLKKIAKVFKSVLRPVDIAGRTGPNKLGAILIESNRRQSQEIGESIKNNLSEVCGPEIKLRFSVAESPIHGITAQELMTFVQKSNNI
ncbi:MAG: diguanylate cyclase [Candidatus Omnitrophica bacterium]|nr:diguanylate cyclase [Candidatus Omnitrophota bacterium]